MTLRRIAASQNRNYDTSGNKRRSGYAVVRASGPETSDSGQRNLLKPPLENQSLGLSRMAGFLGKGNHSDGFEESLFPETGSVSLTLGRADVGTSDHLRFFRMTFGDGG